MDYIRFLRREAADFNKRLILVSVGSGLSNALMIAFMIQAARDVSAGTRSLRHLLLIVLALVGFIWSKGYVLSRSTEIVERIIARIRVRIGEKIRHTELQLLETLGEAPLYTAVTSHAALVSEASNPLVNASSGFFMVCFASLYVITISTTAFYLIVATVVGIVLLFSANNHHATERYKVCAQMENQFFEAFRGLLAGFKELKINRAKSDDFFESRLRELIEATKAVKIESVKANNRTLLIGQSSIFILLLTLLFILPVFAPGDVKSLPAIIAIVLFIFGPMSEIVAVYPLLSRAGLSIQTLARVEELLDGALKTGSTPPQPDFTGPTLPAFKTLELSRIAFHYPDESKFALGPIDLRVEAGEILFLIGGNGSGKSTLLKLITGLYSPQSGAILINGHALGPNATPAYRDLFSAIFTDFYLFDRLYGLPNVDPQLADEWIGRMELTGKTAIVDRLITNTKLSTGQRKRLALVVSMLEDKSIHVFDEWAADQDPEFRRFFYETILPEMKRRGKTVIAATHDDHYFHAADRILKLEYGNFVPYKPHKNGV